jgi:site-specific DNA-methyltransferase (adenine-specific)
MGKDWDKAVPSVKIWKECLRVLKPGAFTFIMSAPRQDVLCRNFINIEKAGFRTEFTSLYWTYAQGFPKARSISKIIDDKYDAKRKIIARNPNSRENCDKTNTIFKSGTVGKTAYITEAATEDAKSLDGSYAGFQPKPAVEVIIVAMKPLDEKNYTDQALSNGKGITWLDDCRIPYKDEKIWSADSGEQWSPEREWNSDCSRAGDQKGRFPANLLVSDDVLDDTSRFFSLDAWADFNIKDLPEHVQRNLPYLIVPKASKKEKNAGCDSIKNTRVGYKGGDLNRICEHCGAPQLKPCDCEPKSWILPKRKNNHPTVKPIELMTYLITMGIQLAQRTRLGFVARQSFPNWGKIV